MNFIFNEKNFVEEIIDGIADTNVVEKLSINYIITMFVKYYKTFGGDDEEYMRIIASTKNTSFYKVYDLFEKKMKMFNEKDCLLREKDNVAITDNEFEQISKIENKRCRKLMFTLLVLSKFYDRQWIKLKFSKLFKLANLPTTVNERTQLIKTLIDGGYICMNNYSSDLSIKVDIEQGKGEEKAYITEISDIGKKYITLTENKIMCKRCGKLIIKTNHVKKYCKNCKEEINRIVNREARRIARNKQKTAHENL